jgi:type VI protein secretion system component VasF
MSRAAPQAERHKMSALDKVLVLGFFGRENIKDARTELATLRALLREARAQMGRPQKSSADLLERIDAALLEE